MVVSVSHEVVDEFSGVWPRPAYGFEYGLDGLVRQGLRACVRLYLAVPLPSGKRHTDRQTDRDTDRHTQTPRDTDRDTDRHRHTETQTETDTERKRPRVSAKIAQNWPAHDSLVTGEQIDQMCLMKCESQAISFTDTMAVENPGGAGCSAQRPCLPGDQQPSAKNQGVSERAGTDDAWFCMT